MDDKQLEVAIQSKIDNDTKTTFGAPVAGLKLPPWALLVLQWGKLQFGSLIVEKCLDAFVDFVKLDLNVVCDSVVAWVNRRRPA